MRNIVILNSLHFSYPLPILMRVSYNTLIVKQNTSDYYKYTKNRWVGERNVHKKLQPDTKGHVRLKLYLKFRKEIGGLECYFNEITGPMGF
jgi:hypothetical protein